MSEIKLSGKFFIMSFLKNENGINGHLDNLKHLKKIIKSLDNLKDRNEANNTIEFISGFLRDVIPFEKEYEIRRENEMQRIENDPEYRNRLLHHLK